MALVTYAVLGVVAASLLPIWRIGMEEGVSAWELGFGERPNLEHVSTDDYLTAYQAHQLREGCLC